MQKLRYFAFQARRQGSRVKGLIRIFYPPADTPHPFEQKDPHAFAYLEEHEYEPTRIRHVERVSVVLVPILVGLALLLLWLPTSLMGPSRNARKTREAYLGLLATGTWTKGVVEPPRKGLEDRAVRYVFRDSRGKLHRGTISRNGGRWSLGQGDFGTEETGSLPAWGRKIDVLYRPDNPSVHVPYRLEREDFERKFDQEFGHLARLVVVAWVVVLPTSAWLLLLAFRIVSSNRMLSLLDRGTDGELLLVGRDLRDQLAFISRGKSSGARTTKVIITPGRRDGSRSGGSHT